MGSWHGEPFSGLTGGWPASSHVSATVELQGGAAGHLPRLPASAGHPVHPHRFTAEGQHSKLSLEANIGANMECAKIIFFGLLFCSLRKSLRVYIPLLCCFRVLCSIPSKESACYFYNMWQVGIYAWNDSRTNYFSTAFCSFFNREWQHSLFFLLSKKSFF